MTIQQKIGEENKSLKDKYHTPLLKTYPQEQYTVKGSKMGQDLCTFLNHLN